MLLLRRFLCFNLHTAGLVLAWLSFVSSVTIWLFALFYLCYTDVLEVEREYASSHKESLRIAYAVVSFTFTEVVASVLLLWGIIQRKHLLIIPWLVNCMLYLILNVLSSIALVIVSMSVGSVSALVAAIAVLIKAGIVAYIWLAVYSIYVNFRNFTAKIQANI